MEKVSAEKKEAYRLANERVAKLKECNAALRSKSTELAVSEASLLKVQEELQVWTGV